jgi:uncharacterized membrane protein (Fun14 family)
MNIDYISSIVGTLGGSFFVSFLIGYFIKKIIKILMFVLGGILALLMYLQYQGIINVDKSVIAANTTKIFPSDNDPSIIGNNLGIPLAGSIASGFMLGITRRG